MTLNVDKADSIRRYWISDPMTKWEIYDYELSVEHKGQCTICPDGSIITANEKCNECHEKAIYLGYMLNIWGHCITDNLKKLWYLDSAECKKLQKEGYKLYCTLHGTDKCFIQQFKSLLSYLSIDSEDIYIITEPTSFEDCIEPQSALDKNHHLHKMLIATVDRIKSRLSTNPSSPKKIYFSRANFKNGRDFGEKAIENVFSCLGYSIIYPEQYSLNEQLEMLYSCDSFAATEGSISHNVMFCRKEAEAIIIRKTRSCNGYQYSSNFIFGGNLIYIDAHLSLFNIFDNAFGPFFLYVNQNLADFAKERGLTIKKHFPKFTFLNYLAHTLYYALRYRKKVLKIGDFDFYKKRLEEDFFS